MCQPVHIVAKEITDGRNSLPEQVLSSPRVGVVGIGVVLPEVNAPHLVKRAGLR